MPSAKRAPHANFRPENFAFHTELMALAKKQDDTAAREWAALTTLRGDWLAQSGSNWGIAHGELDALKTEYRKGGQQEKIAELEQKQREAESTDIVAVMSWNTNGADIDLHIEEPGNQNVSYNARSSFRGGNLDRDVTTGYGPETYTLRHAPAGHFRFKVHYYRGEQLTDVTLKLTRNKGSAHETEQTFHIQLKSTNDERVVTEFDIP